MNFQFQLEQGSTKFSCPKCGQKRFKRYVETQSGAYISAEFGRCDRENSCGYHVHPVKGQCNTSTVKYLRNSLRSEENTQCSIINIPHSYAVESLRSTNCENKYLLNAFAAFIQSVFGASGTEALARYMVGTYRNTTKTVFWQMSYDVETNSSHEIRTGKVIDYDASGHRKKNSPPFFIHTELVQSNILDANALLRQCFFGEHLLVQKTKKVCIVESEKTAVIASIVFPKFVWLATGGKFGCKWYKESVFRVLAGRDVILYPDVDTKNDCFTQWSAFGKTLQQSRFGINVGISTLINDYASHEERAQGYDLADYLVEYYQSLQQSNKSSEVMLT